MKETPTVVIELTGAFALTLAAVVGFAFGVLFGVLA